MKIPKVIASVLGLRPIVHRDPQVTEQVARSSALLQASRILTMEVGALNSQLERRAHRRRNGSYPRLHRRAAP